MNKNFAIMGVGGYIAPRHLEAIKATNNNLIAALDKFDSVGVIDSYFPEAHFFTEFERFDRHIEKLKRKKNILLDYVSICTPNYLHDAHIRMSLRQGANAICEKPIVINPWNVDQLIEIEKIGTFQDENGDGIADGTEVFEAEGTVTSGAVTSISNGTVTENDADDAPVVTIGSVTVTEGDTAEVPVTLDVPSTEDIVVEVIAAALAAIAVPDFRNFRRDDVGSWS